MRASVMRRWALCLTVMATMGMWCLPGTASALTPVGYSCSKLTFPNDPAKTGSYCQAPLSMYPSYRGWKVSIDGPIPNPCGSVEIPHCMGALTIAPTWVWGATGWTKSTAATAGFNSYVYPFSTSWRWVWQQRGTNPGQWHAVELSRLTVNWFVPAA